jgi:hypothetical protein
MKREDAFHEAAHAVADLRFGFGWTRAVGSLNDLLSIVPEHDGRLPWKPVGRVARPKPRMARNKVVALLAGYAAERRIGVPESLARAGALNDFEKAERMYDFAGVDETRAIASAMSFVEDSNNWRAIELIADEAVEREVLSGKELERLLKVADGLAPPEANG